MKPLALLLFSFLSFFAYCQAAPQPTQICGAPIVMCPNQQGTCVACPRGDSADSCNLSLSFISCLKTPAFPGAAAPDPAIIIARDDIVTWYSDQAGSNGKPVRMRFDKFDEETADTVLHQHLECGIVKNDPLPFTDDFGEGKEKYSLRKATIVRQDAVRGACFKHHIWVRDDYNPPPASENSLDPHVIIGDPASLLVYKVDFTGHPIKRPRSAIEHKP